MSQPTLDLHEFTRHVAEAYHIPYDMAERLFYSESGYEHYSSPGVVKLEAGGSGVGVGIGQVSRATARSYNLDPENPQQNITASLRYLREMYTRFRSWPMAYAAYRAGPNAAGITNGQLPPGVSQTAVDFFLGVPGTVLHGLTVGQGGVPAASGSDVAPGEPSPQSEFITLPDGTKIPNPLYNLEQAGAAGNNAISGLPAALAEGLSKALTDAGINSSNRVASWWNANGGTLIFYGIALIAVIMGALLIQSQKIAMVTEAARVPRQSFGSGQAATNK